MSILASGHCFAILSVSMSLRAQVLKQVAAECSGSGARGCDACFVHSLLHVSQVVQDFVHRPIQIRVFSYIIGKVCVFTESTVASTKRPLSVHCISTVDA